MNAIESLDATAYTVETDLPEADGTATWDSTTLVAVRLHADGCTGLGWTYGPPACASVVDGTLRRHVVGHDAMDIPGLWDAMAANVRNATRAGVAAYAISAVDVAAWDLKSRLLGVSLARLFGRAHVDVPVYGSGGFTNYSDDQLREQLTRWVTEKHMPRVKIKIGGLTEPDDLRRLRVARDTVGDDVGLYVDANGAYGRKQAVRVLERAADADVTWFEEPVSSDDLDGLRMVRDRVNADVAAGEYGTGVYYFRRMCEAEAVDCLQIDATRCGGYSEWLRSAAVAASFGLDVSGHCAPHLHAPVAAATPNLRHVEWFHDHVRIEHALLHGTLDPVGGQITPSRDEAGHGMRLRDDADAYRVTE